jgi:competence protein ComEC
MHLSDLRHRAAANIKRHPLFWLALVTVACVATVNLNVPLGVSLVAVLGLAAGLLGGWRFGAGCLLCGWFSAAVFIVRCDAQKWDELRLVGVQGVEMEGRVLEDATGPRNFWSAPVVLKNGDHAGAKVLWKGRGELPVAGARVRALGSFTALPQTRNPGEFDRAAWLGRKGVAAVFQADSLDGEVQTGRLAAIGAQVRRGFRNAVTFGLEENSTEAGVIRAIVIGEQPQDATELVDAFRNSGTLHAFSVSGLHVAMVGSMGWLVLRFLGVPRRWAILGLIPLIFSYSWVTGNTPPAVRAAWMALVFLGAFLARRQPDLLNSLGAVLLAAMLWDGRLIFQPGVQLSYGVVAAIAIGVGLASRMFAWMTLAPLYLAQGEMSRWQQIWLGFRQKLAQSLGVSMAAGVGSTPLTMIHFQLFTPISVIAGVVLVPVVFMLLGTSLVGAVFYPLAPSVTRLVNLGNSHLAHACVKIAEAFAAVPGGHFKLQSSDPLLLVYDLESGDSAACFTGGGVSGALLVDCADSFSFKRQIAPSLQQLGITPDSVALSHPDGGHLGGGAAVWETFPIRQALLPVEKSRSPVFRSWLKNAPLAGVKTFQVSDFSRLPLPDGAHLEVMHVPNPVSQNMLADDRVAIFRIHWNGWKILFTSDAGVATEQQLLAKNTDLSADVIIAGKHRWDASLTDAFLDAVNPRVIIASNSLFPASEALSPQTVSYWRSRGIRVFDQRRTGGVTLRTDPAKNLRITGFVDGSQVMLRAR